MSEDRILQQFNINELAGATGLILGGISGLLVVIFKSRCYCKMNLCKLCFCERKPPVEKEEQDSDEEDKKKDKDKKDKNKKDKNKNEIPDEENLIPTTSKDKKQDENIIDNP
jgi:hypothetical protein